LTRKLNNPKLVKFMSSSTAVLILARSIHPHNLVTVMIAAPLGWINTFPGSEKLTVARILLERSGKEEMAVIDNHQSIEPVEAKFSRDLPGYQNER
jgi:hypothetical protein